MLAGILCAPLLQGARGTDPVALDAVVDAALALCDLAQAMGDSYQSIEVNPLRADARGAEALDGLIVWSDTAAHHLHRGEEA